ncbi:hypothetical protein HNY73_015044 [Argiope bruennichi]|uniref:Uncharacterized protein n=1 Tax=Argiope bruennichi TaxID=94029 RepID=A0A8T0ER69_ARGBR|nr:hypothetical protein HNY73_015044 [Argiope bruennichi]
MHCPRRHHQPQNHTSLTCIAHAATTNLKTTAHSHSLPTPQNTYLKTTTHTQALPTPQTPTSKPQLTHKHCPRRKHLPQNHNSTQALPRRKHLLKTTTHTQALPTPQTPTQNHNSHTSIAHARANTYSKPQPHTQALPTPQNTYLKTTTHTQALPTPQTPTSKPHSHTSMPTPQTPTSKPQTHTQALPTPQTPTSKPQLTHKHCPRRKHLPQNHNSHTRHCPRRKHLPQNHNSHTSIAHVTNTNLKITSSKRITQSLPNETLHKLDSTLTPTPKTKYIHFYSVNRTRTQDARSFAMHITKEFSYSHNASQSDTRMHVSVLIAPRRFCIKIKNGI